MHLLSSRLWLLVAGTGTWNMQEGFMIDERGSQPVDASQSWSSRASQIGACEEAAVALVCSSNCTSAGGAKNNLLIKHPSL
jgi:hypothetical protein